MFACLKLVVACLPLAVAASISCAAGTSPAAAGTGGVNAPSAVDKPYLVLISIDGYRWDYLERYPTNALGELAARGVRAESLRPVYPTLTFPNHYSIATGLYPAEHGIVANDFPAGDGERWYRYRQRDTVQDGRFYGGEPIWVAAERGGMVSAAYYFVGTEAPVDGIAPSHWRAFDAAVPGEERVAQALDWLSLPAARRPHVVTLYFEHVDMASHRFGPGSPESVAAIEQVDGYLAKLLAGLEALAFRDEIYVVVVSDHGQSRYRDDAKPLVLDEFLDLDGVDVVEAGAFAFLYFDDDGAVRAAAVRDAVNARWEHGRALLRAEAPASWRLAADPRIPDLILQADGGYGVFSSGDLAHRMTAGDHGWAPGFRDMHGIFVASGPRLPAGERVGVVEAVEVYPLLLDVLGLPDNRPVRHASTLATLLETRVPASRPAVAAGAGAASRRE